MFKAILLLGLAISLTSGCTGDPLRAKGRSKAPRGAQDTGLILSRTTPSEVTQLLAKFPEARVRTLNTRHGLFEIFGLEPSDLPPEFEGHVENNQFIPNETIAIPAPEGFQVGHLTPCTITETPPSAQILTSFPLTETVNLGEPLEFTGSAADDSARIAFQVVRQDSLSENKDLIFPSHQFSLTPDTLGLHKVFLVAQDAQNGCGIQALQFIVTDNPVFEGPQPDQDFSLVDQVFAHFASMFTHLDQVAAADSWTISQGEGVLVAIIDTGVNYNHPALIQQIARLGPDLINGDDYPYDDSGHGTHVAGLIAGRQFGMAQKAKILPIKAMDSLGSDMATIAAAILYSVDQGAKIINLSAGSLSTEPAQALLDAVAYAEKNGVLLVVAAGNGDPASGFGFDLDQKPVYPASLPNDNILTVAAFDSMNLLSLYSNFGAQSVDVIAPGGWDAGEPIYSTALANPEGQWFTSFSGTSQAAPIAAGIAAQIASLHPEFGLAQIKAKMIQAGTETEDLKNLSQSGRHLNAHSALLARP